jgi:hypothetical protein
MRRDLNWKTKRPDGTAYEVRVTTFGKKFKFQFQDKGAKLWDYEQKPSRDDLEYFLKTMERYYQRSRATLDEFEQAKRMLADFDREAAR